MEQRLRRAGFEGDAVAETLIRLEASGLLDDDRFAAEFVRGAVQGKRTGVRRVHAALRTKGVAEETIARHLEPELATEGERAETLARTRASRLRNLDPRVARRRLFEFLIRRGYDPATATAAAARALEAGDAPTEWD